MMVVSIQYILIKEGGKRGVKKVTEQKEKRHIIGEEYYKYM